MSALIGIQLKFFLISVVSGIVLLMSYDGIRIFRRIMRHKNYLVYIEDIMFWLISAVLIFAMMFKQNNGTIRGFSIMGMVIGMLAYNFSISPYVVNGVSKAMKFVLGVIKKIIDFLLSPFAFFIKKIYWLFKKIKRYLGKHLLKLRKLVKISVTKE